MYVSCMYSKSPIVIRENAKCSLIFLILSGVGALMSFFVYVFMCMCV